MRAVADAEKIHTVPTGRGRTINSSRVTRNVAAYAGRSAVVVVMPVYCTESAIISMLTTPNTRGFVTLH